MKLLEIPMRKIGQPVIVESNSVIHEVNPNQLNYDWIRENVSRGVALYSLECHAYLSSWDLTHNNEIIWVEL